MSDINSIKQSIDEHIASIAMAYRRAFIKAVAELGESEDFCSISVQIDSDEFLNQRSEAIHALSGADSMKLIALLAQEASE